MLPPSAEPARLAERYRLAQPAPRSSGAAGERLGRGVGASLEFQDRRSYAPGDDVRHIDWRAFARSDQLLVRMYREEVLPRLELIVDASRSMGVAQAKARTVVDLAALLARVARDSAFEPHLIIMADQPAPVALEHLLLHGLAFDGTTPLPQGLEQAHGFCRPGALRIVISDFLFPHAARSLLGQLKTPPAMPVLLQVLTGSDAAPERGAALKLVDSETSAAVDVVLDDASVARYLQRLARLQDELRTECRRCAGHFLTLAAERPLADSCLALVELGLLAVR